MSATDQPLGGPSPFGGSPLGIDAAQAAHVAMFLAQNPAAVQGWTVPVTGYFRIVQWGPGKSTSPANPGGGSGAYCETVAALAKGQTVNVQVGPHNTGIDTVVTLPNGRVIIAGSAGVLPAGGVASGGDYMLDGSAGGSGTGVDGGAGLGTGGGLAGNNSAAAGGGAGAPGRLPFRGGSGARTSYGGSAGTNPGGGGATGAAQGGDGLVLIILQPTAQV